MFVVLYKNSNATSTGQAIVKAISGVLTGTYLIPSQLDTNHWDTTKCLWNAGSYQTENIYWTLVNDSSSSASSGSIILSSDSAIVGKKNYIKISYASSSAVYFSVGSDYSSGSSLVNEYACYIDSRISTTGICRPSVALVSTPINIRFSRDFINIWCPFQVNYVSSAYNVYMFLGVEMTANSYDLYSTEGTFKGIGLGRYVYTPESTDYTLANATITVSNYYSPNTDKYSNAIRWSNCYNNFLRSDTVGISRLANGYDKINALVPMTFSKYSDGWIGGNVSSTSGVYLSTCGNKLFFSPNDDIVTLGNLNYKVYTVPAYSDGNGSMVNTTFLMKL